MLARRKVVDCQHSPTTKGLTVGTILLIILILLLLGALPSWPHSRGWGNRPAGLLGLVLVILLIMLLVGWIPWGFSTVP
jgi:Protein of unknown function (DUF3309)